MVKIIATSASGKGFITHLDQESLGLSFSVLCEKDGVSYIQVTGGEAQINQWVQRVGGTQVEEVEIPAAPPSIEDRVAAIEDVLLMLI